MSEFIERLKDIEYFEAIVIMGIGWACFTLEEIKRKIK